MMWTKGHLYIPQYKFISSNQHGDRFKRINGKHLSVANISCEPADAGGMKILILLSHILDVPVRYDFEDDQCAYIEVISNEALRECV